APDQVDDAPHLPGRRAHVLHGCARLRHLPRPRPSLVPRVRTERARRREFAELVPDHGLGDEHGDVLAPVVHRDRVTEHVRHDRRAADTGPDDHSRALFFYIVYLLHHILVNERTLFYGT